MHNKNQMEQKHRKRKMNEIQPSQVEAFVCVKMKNCFFSSVQCLKVRWTGMPACLPAFLPPSQVKPPSLVFVIKKFSFKIIFEKWTISIWLLFCISETMLTCSKVIYFPHFQFSVNSSNCCCSCRSCWLFRVGHLWSTYFLIIWSF